MRYRIFSLIGSMTLGFAAVLAAAASAGAAPEKPGAAIYRQRCQSCHGVPGQRSALAPSLVGVVGRRAASTPFNYSPALQKSGLTWDRANLDRFIAAPGRTVPGTRMVINLSNPAQRADIIDYLASLR